ncbi:MAG: phosphatidylserine decarboxylase family protein [Bacteroidales bacterium]|nr:phosphatidylserine decarboxylase family protein [Bacteroidales bacterium]
MKIKIHKEGIPIIATVFLLLLALVVLIDILFPKQTIFHYLLYISAILFYFFVVRFFRDPLREVVPNDDIVLSGADGKVVVIEEVEENEYFHDKRLQVSVFMSPTNVHVNWFPVGGKIKYFKHNHGFYFIASHPKSSHQNERTTVVVENNRNTEIMFRQIAGTVARRIICNAKEGKEVIQGNELGIIKFGSRFDLFLPLDAKIEVKLDQKVTGCNTVIAMLR